MRKGQSHHVCRISVVTGVTVPCMRNSRWSLQSLCGHSFTADFVDMLIWVWFRCCDGEQWKDIIFTSSILSNPSYFKVYKILVCSCGDESLDLGNFRLFIVHSHTLAAAMDSPNRSFQITPYQIGCICQKCQVLNCLSKLVIYASFVSLPVKHRRLRCSVFTHSISYPLMCSSPHLLEALQ